MARSSVQARTQLAAIRQTAVALHGTDDDEREILAFIGDASLVLLGDGTHGTHDFYAARARLTRRLIVEHDFTAVAIEGDWPDAYRVNRYVQSVDDALTADAALAEFRRFPTWMWRNTATTEFIVWLKQRNAVASTPENRVGFYGLDLYSLHTSMQAVVDYLDQRDPIAARGARRAYACFDQFGGDPESYAWAASRLGGETCEDAAVRQLLVLHHKRDDLLRRRGASEADEFFYATQNARLVRNAEEYYRTMFHGRVESWNIRDRHMAETLEALLTHLREQGKPPKVVVWAHNSHLGDARATGLGDSGELNLGQLVRERHGAAARLIGCTTYRGTVIAASDWGAPAERKTVRPALAGSYEALLHRVELPRFFLPFAAGSAVSEALAPRLLERAIGVIYRPDTERHSHYFEASLPQQFDAILHFDETRALEPLERLAAVEPSEAPETFPSGV
jgi:erythromycin esterase-like protein